MNQAVEIFTRVPKTHNCVQAAAACCGLEELAEALKPWEGGGHPKGAAERFWRF